jgi:5-carboxymethyl-2-hydroxymuconate isomerase
MPHMVILYTTNLESPTTDIQGLCQAMAATMRDCHDDDGKAVFPLGGIRVLAIPAPVHAVADGDPKHGFIYLNLRMARGRSAAVKQRVGEALQDRARQHLAPALAQHTFGVTLQIDEGTEVFDAKIGNLHAHFANRT